MLTLIKKRFKVFITLLCFIMVMLLCFPCFAIVKPTKEFYVNDYANVLSSTIEQYIINTNKQLEEKTGAQIVVVTVESLEGMALEEYANTLFRNFGIGDRQKNNGLLILLSLQERKCRVEVGYGLEGILPDGKTGRIQDEYMIPYFKENDFEEGMKNGYNAFLTEISMEYQVSIEDSNQPVKGQILKQNNVDISNVIVPIIVINLLFTSFFRMGYRRKKSKIGIICYLFFMLLESIIILVLTKQITYLILILGLNFIYFSSRGNIFFGGGFGGGRRIFKRRWLRRWL